MSDKYLQVLEQCIDAIVSINHKKEIIFYNNAAEEMFGYSRDEVMGQNVKMIVPMDHRANHDGYVDANMRTGVNKVVGKSRDLEMTRKDGSKFWGNLSLSKVEENGQYEYTAFIKNITEQVNQRETLEQQAREIQARMASVDTACIVSETDLKGYITYVNDKFCEVAQYTREELMGANHNVVRHPDMPKEAFKELWSTIGKGNIFRAIVKNKKKDGSPYYIDGIFTPVLGANGKPIKYIGIRYDITETTLEKQRMQGIVDAIDSSYAFIEFDTKGNIINANENFLKTTEYSLNEITGKHHRIFVDKEYILTSDYSKFWNDLASGIAQIGQYKRITKSGKEIWLQAVYSPVKDDMGRIIKVIKIATDITGQKQILANVQRIVALASNEGKLNERINTEDVDTGLKELVQSVNSLMDVISKPIGEVQKLAHVVASSAEEMTAKGEQMQSSTAEMSSAVQQMAEGAQQQAQKTDEVSKLVDGVLKSAGEMSNQADVILKAAVKGQDSCTAGMQTIKKVVENMSEIQDAAKSTSHSINVLSERSEEIASTLNVITDIASQTNLLALNAAIEAARAGDAGRGFAVVAEEIRKLAEDSRKSAINIEKVIREVQKDIHSATRAIESMDTSVKSGNMASREAEVVFESIATSSEETLTLSKEILAATGVQKEAMNNTVKNIEQIVVVSEETAAGTEEIATSAKALSQGMNEVSATSKDLADVATQLMNGVSRFKV
jgi:methyl-accepting chemotaxis protein